MQTSKQPRKVRPAQAPLASPKGRLPTVNTDLLLLDLARLFSHDIEKSASAMRMFFEIYKKETPSPKDLQRWSHNVERSFFEPRKWLRWLSTSSEQAREDTAYAYRDLREELHQLVTELDLTVTGKGLEALPEFPLSPNSNTCLWLYKEYARRNYETLGANLTALATPQGISISLSQLGKRPSPVAGALLAEYLLTRQLPLASASFTVVSSKELRLELGQV